LDFQWAAGGGTLSQKAIDSQSKLASFAKLGNCAGARNIFSRRANFLKEIS
jgi:hypothetical protein